jgi:sugar/nucleoside kinase (ribokinase family)
MGPILQEIPRTLALSLAKRDGIVSLDPQGYLRQILRRGRIRRLKWADKRLLRTLDVLKLSEHEANKVIGRNCTSPQKLGKLGPEVILITRGAAGTILWSKTIGMFHVPAFKTKVRDPTGAGDALVGALLVNWVKEGDLLWAAAIGSAVASFVVENVGPAAFGTPHEIKKRALIVSEKTVRK